MPVAILPRTKAERRHWARHIGNDLRASLPWWQFTERFRIGVAIDMIRPGSPLY